MRHNFPDHYDMEDIYGVAVKALIVSVNQFDPTKGRAFVTQHYEFVVLYLMNSGNWMHYLGPIVLKQDHYRRQLEILSKNIITPSEKEICEELDLTVMNTLNFLMKPNRSLCSNRR